MMETHSDFQKQYQDELNGKNKTASTVLGAGVWTAEIISVTITWT